MALSSLTLMFYYRDITTTETLFFSVSFHLSMANLTVSKSIESHNITQKFSVRNRKDEIKYSHRNTRTNLEPDFNNR